MVMLLFQSEVAIRCSRLGQDEKYHYIYIYFSELSPKVIVPEVKVQFTQSASIMQTVQTEYKFVYVNTLL